MESSISLQYTLLTWMIVIFIVAIIAYSIYNHEFKQKYGFTRNEFKHYRKMMTSSSYRYENKKGLAKANPSSIESKSTT